MISTLLLSFMITVMAWMLQTAGSMIKLLAEQEKEDIQTPLIEWANKQMERLGNLMISLSYMAKMTREVLQIGLIHRSTK